MALVVVASVVVAAISAADLFLPALEIPSGADDGLEAGVTIAVVVVIPSSVAPAAVMTSCDCRGATGVLSPVGGDSWLMVDCVEKEFVHPEIPVGGVGSEKARKREEWRCLSL